MERLPHRIRIERTPEEQAERIAQDEAIRRRFEAGEGPPAGIDDNRRAAGPPDWPAKRVVAALRAERQQLGLSLADVADRMGADRGAVHKIEIGLNRNPTFDTLSRFADALGMDFAVVRRSGAADSAAPDQPGQGPKRRSRAIETD